MRVSVKDKLTSLTHTQTHTHKHITRKRDGERRIMKQKNGLYNKTHFSMPHQNDTYTERSCASSRTGLLFWFWTRPAFEKLRLHKETKNAALVTLRAGQKHAACICINWICDLSRVRTLKNEKCCSASYMSLWWCYIGAGRKKTTFIQRSKTQLIPVLLR